MSNKIRQKLERALIYIEQNLEKIFTVTEVASYAGISNFHFQRVFSAYLGETVSRYILHRRLELAAKKIVHDKRERITDIAIVSGFETHSAFSRAFKQHFGISPSEFRDTPYSANLGSDKSRPFLNTEAAPIESIPVSVEEQDTVWFNYRSLDMHMAEDGSFSKESVMKMEKGYFELIFENKDHILGLGASREEGLSDWPINLVEDFDVIKYGAFYTEKTNNAWGDDCFEIEAGLWAVCTHKGAYEYLYQTWNHVLRSWLPDSGYELRDTMSFGLYINSIATVTSDDELLSKLYIPIKKLPHTS